MKKSFLSIFALAFLFFAGSAFVSDKKATIPNDYAEHYLYSVTSADLEARFEAQFYDIFTDVSHIDIHQNQSGDYYYTVYGKDATGKSIVDYFKTSQHEVETETYNYIEMNERTLGAKKCREAIVWPTPSGYFCHPTNPGYICGIEVWPNVCFLY